MASSKPKPAPKPAPEDDGVATFTVEGKTYSVKFTGLTLGELVELERFVGRPFQDIDYESASGITGLAWVAIHRQNPAFTFDDALKLPLSAFSENSEPDPT